MDRQSLRDESEASGVGVPINFIAEGNWDSKEGSQLVNGSVLLCFGKLSVFVFRHLNGSVESLLAGDVEAPAEGVAAVSKHSYDLLARILAVDNRLPDIFDVHPEEQIRVDTLRQ